MRSRRWKSVEIEKEITLSHTPSLISSHSIIIIIIIIIYLFILLLFGFPSQVPDVAVYGGVGDNIPGVTKEVQEGDEIHLGSTNIRVLFTPCHTAGHVCYLATCPGGSPQSLFTGDTLFVAGCGNFNDGTPAQMYDALYHKIARLSPETKAS